MTPQDATLPRVNMLPPEYEEKRLKALWTSAIESASKINLQASQVSSDLGKDKTHYFEKIAFGSGATIAAVVSFIGVHSDELHPRCLLRSILVLLALTMVGALYRNWRFPYYVLAFWAGQNFSAQQNRERCKRDYINAFGAQSVSLEDGKPFDIEKWQKDFLDSVVTRY